MPVNSLRVSRTSVVPTSWLIDNTELPLDNRSFRHGNPKFHTPFVMSRDSSLHAHDPRLCSTIPLNRSAVADLWNVAVTQRSKIKSQNGSELDDKTEPRPRRKRVPVHWRVIRNRTSVRLENWRRANLKIRLEQSRLLLYQHDRSNTGRYFYQFRLYLRYDKNN